MLYRPQNIEDIIYNLELCPISGIISSDSFSERLDVACASRTPHQAFQKKCPNQCSRNLLESLKPSRRPKPAIQKVINPIQQSCLFQGTPALPLIYQLPP